MQYSESAHRYTDTQIHRYTDTQIQRYTDTQIQRYTDIQIYRYTDTQIDRYKDTQIHRYTETKIHRYTMYSMYCTLYALWFFWTLFTLWISCTLCWEFKFYLILISTLQLHKKYLAASTILAKSQNRWIFYLDILQIHLPPFTPPPPPSFPICFQRSQKNKLYTENCFTFIKKT